MMLKSSASESCRSRSARVLVSFTSYNVGLVGRMAREEHGRRYVSVGDGCSLHQG
jgi:hypothetical protein